MLTATLRDGLKGYAIGEKIRVLRLKKKMGLVELGGHTGLSPAMLSKIERGRLFPTLPTLLRIALVFSVGLEFFFAGARDKPVAAVVRRKDRLRFPQRPGGLSSAYEFQSLDFPAAERRFDAFYADFLPSPAREPVQRHHHPGAEFIYIVRGTLKVEVGEEEHVLDEGDSIYFDPTVAHGYRRQGTHACSAIVITAG